MLILSSGLILQVSGAPAAACCVYLQAKAPLGQDVSLAAAPVLVQNMRAINGSDALTSTEALLSPTVLCSVAGSRNLTPQLQADMLQCVCQLLGKLAVAQQQQNCRWVQAVHGILQHPTSMCCQTARFLLKDAPASVIDSSAITVLQTAAAVVASSTQQPRQCAARDAYFALEGGLLACLVAAPADQQLSFATGAKEALQLAMGTNILDRGGQCVLLASLPVLVSATGQATGAPVVAKQATADAVADVGRLMLHVLQQCERLHSSGSNAELLASPCNCITDLDPVDTIEERLQLTEVTAAECLAGVLQQLHHMTHSSSCTDNTCYSSCGHISRSDGDTSSSDTRSNTAAAATAFDGLVAAGSITVLEATLRKLRNGRQWRKPSDRGCLCGAQLRILLVCRACSWTARRLAASGVSPSGEVSDAKLAAVAEGAAAAISRLALNLRSPDIDKVPTLSRSTNTKGHCLSQGCL